MVRYLRWPLHERFVDFDLALIFSTRFNDIDGGRCPVDAPLLSLAMKRVEDFIHEFLQV